MSKVNIPKALISHVTNRESYVRFVRRAKPIAQRMVNEYTAKQRAYAAVNTQHNKTGQIDMSRIAQVYTSDDIFVKKTIEAAGQSHGLILVIDWSGSMGPHIESMAMQYLVTALFAKRANIPLEVYLFTTPDYGRSQPLDGFGNDLSMRLILNTKTASESDIIEIFYHMICVYHTVYSRIVRMNTYYNTKPTSAADDVLARRMLKLFAMGGTPLVQATSQAYLCAHRMKIRESLQNMTVMFITDGVGSRMRDGKTNEDITTLVCPFTSRRFESRDKPGVRGGHYYNSGMGALSAVNEMMASQGIKSINLFIGRTKAELGEAVYMVSSQNADDDEVIRNTLYKTRTTELYDFGSIGNYTRYVALMARMFPKIEDADDLGDDTISGGKGTLQRRFTSSTNDTKNITRVCGIIVDEICSDFKIK